MSEPSRKSRAEARCEAQRARILLAARKCFAESGFHAANMASIAETAGVSAGLIYRYFDSKNAIILAIIERKLNDVQADIRRLRSDSAGVARRLVELFDGWRRNEGTALEPGLFLEIVALATRDRQVAGALHAADRSIRAELGGWLMQVWQNAGHDLTETEMVERVFFLQCCIEGLVIRAIKQPDCQQSLVEGSLKPLLDHLLPDDSKRGRRG